MSSQAGPSTHKKSKKVKLPPETTKTARVMPKDTVQTDTDDDDDDDEDEDEDESESADSEGDIEGVKSKRKSETTAASPQKRVEGKKLPYVLVMTPKKPDEIDHITLQRGCTPLPPPRHSIPLHSNGTRWLRSLAWNYGRYEYLLTYTPSLLLW